MTSLPKIKRNARIFLTSLPKPKRDVRIFLKDLQGAFDDGKFPEMKAKAPNNFFIWFFLSTTEIMTSRR